MARKNRMAEPIKLEFLMQSAEERLPLPDSSGDRNMLWTEPAVLFA
jgi:hypothetical protein